MLFTINYQTKIKIHTVSESLREISTILNDVGPLNKDKKRQHRVFVESVSPRERLHHMDTSI